MEVCAIVIFLLHFVVFGAPRLDDIIVTWNGTVYGRYSLPVLFVYQDEITTRTRFGLQDRPNSGELLCKSPRPGAHSIRWYFPNGTLLEEERGASVMQIKEEGLKNFPVVSKVRNRYGYTHDYYQSGLWNCRVFYKKTISILVGVYQRGAGYGSIESVRLDYVAFANNRLLLNLWVFGGPPSKLNWWSNSRGSLRNDSEHGMFIIYRPENTNDAVRYAIRFYISGHRPGIYSFSVGNRDTRVSKTAEIDIDGGGQVPRVTWQQVGFNDVQITWFPPLNTDPPKKGYRVILNGRNHSQTLSPIMATSLNFTVPRIGNYMFSVIPISDHYPAKELEVTVPFKGILPPVIMVVPGDTFAFIFIGLNQFGLQWDYYTISVDRILGEGQELCPDISDEHYEAVPSLVEMTFNNLEAFSSYIVTVTAGYRVYGDSATRIDSAEFTTLTATPNRAPNILVTSATESTVRANWTEIDCIGRNGQIIGYEVILEEETTKDRFRGTIQGRTFTADGLTPFRSYVFRVAGVTVNGSGIFSQPVVISTTDGSPGRVGNLTARRRFTSMDISWRPPSQTSGIITNYDIIYRIGAGGHITFSVGTQTSYTIGSLAPETIIPDVTVIAFNSAGPGVRASLVGLTTLSLPAKVRNVRTFVIDLHTIEVSWDSSSRIAASVGYSIIGHRVYYSLLQSSGDESSITVHGGFTFAFIEDLRALTQYKIEVAILADYDGDMALGLRSDPVATTTYVNSTGFVIAPTNASIEESVDGSQSGGLVGGLVGLVSFAILVGTVAAVMFYRRRKKRTGERSLSIPQSSQGQGQGRYYDYEYDFEIEEEVVEEESIDEEIKVRAPSSGIASSKSGLSRSTSLGSLSDYRGQNSEGSSYFY